VCFAFALLKVTGYGRAKAEPDREEDSNRRFFFSSPSPSFSRLTSYFRKNERKTQQNEGNTFLSVDPRTPKSVEVPQSSTSCKITQTRCVTCSSTPRLVACLTHCYAGISKR